MLGVVRLLLLLHNGGVDMVGDSGADMVPGGRIEVGTRGNPIAFRLLSRGGLGDAGRADICRARYGINRWRFVFGNLYGWRTEQDDHSDIPRRSAVGLPVNRDWISAGWSGIAVSNSHSCQENVLK